MDDELRNAYEDLLGSVSKMRTLDHMNRYVIDGLTTVEMRVLVAIFFAWRSCDEIRPGMISASVGSTKSALSQVLKSLEDKGFIERNRSQKDSRAVAIELTEKSKDAMSSLRGVLDAEMMDLVAYIGIDDLRHLKHTVDKIVEFKQLREQQGDKPASLHRESGLSSVGADGLPGADARFATMRPIPPMPLGRPFGCGLDKKGE